MGTEDISLLEARQSISSNSAKQATHYNTPKDCERRLDSSTFFRLSLPFLAKNAECALLALDVNGPKVLLG